MFTTMQECKARCMFIDACKSINYQMIGDNICELNNRTTEDVRYKVVLEKKMDWVYATTDYNQTKVGDICRKSNPCGENVLCMDTCTCPGYRCYNCAPHEIGMDCHQPWKDCDDVKRDGHTESGIYVINPTSTSNNAFSVYCDFKTDQNAWIVFQRRVDGRESFERGWKEYEEGFGSLYGSFWLGLQKLFYLTRRTALLRIELMSLTSSEKKFAEYATFAVNDKSDYYRLSVGSFSEKSTVANSLTYTGTHNLNGMKFSTFDSDNDGFPDKNCASLFKGGWWHNMCFIANLNGLYGNVSAGNYEYAKYMTWYGICECFGGITFSEMKIRYV
eukprot:gene17456-9061_t